VLPFNNILARLEKWVKYLDVKTFCRPKSRIYVKRAERESRVSRGNERIFSRREAGIEGLDR